MKRKRSWIVAALALALAGSWAISFGAGRLQAQAAANFAPTPVAVVNISELISNSAERIAFNERMQTRNTEFQAEGQRRQQAIEVMQRDLDILPAGSPERLKKEEEILGKVADLQAWQQLQQQLALRESRLALIALYRKVNQTTERIAQARGIEIVILDTPVPPLEQMNPEQITQTINGRSVMYRADRVDITADVLAQLNADWNNRANN